ncbi:cytochrome-c peroxidase [Chondromyces apiculatus]|nr:cytochrome c peroxidase [Chondromyces apiculatus]
MASGCSAEEALIDGLFTPVEWEKVQTLSPLPEVPEDTTNRYADDPNAAALGQRLFFEKGYSGPIAVGGAESGALGEVGETGRVACASCHHGTWLIDHRSTPNNASLGTAWIPRNANSVINAAFYEPWIENDGVSDSLWSDVLVDPELNIAMDGSRLQVVHVLWEKYRDEYNAMFDPDLDADLDPASENADRFPATGKPGSEEWDRMTAEDQETVTGIYVNFGKAVAAYLRLLVSREAPFDRYVAGETGAIGEDAKHGLQLFVGKAGCVACHSGSHFSDDEFHVNGLAPAGPNINPEELGRATAIDNVLKNPFNSDGIYSDDRATGRLEGLKKTEEAVGQWRTKGLRHIAETAPYMHTGQLETLRDVVTFYNTGGHATGFVGVKSDKMKPLNLTDEEIDHLVAFLETLTGAPVDEALREDTSAR